MKTHKEKLFSEFSVPTTQEWLDKIQVDLKGADFNKKLVWRTNEGFNVQPFYRKENLNNLKTPNALPAKYPFVRGNRVKDNLWYVRQNIIVDDPTKANIKALDILNKGIDSIGFYITPTEITPNFVENLLKDIYCECIELNFHTCFESSIHLAKILKDYYCQHNNDKTKIRGVLEWDPLCEMVMNGKDTEGLLNDGVDLIKTFEEYDNIQCITVDSVSLCNAGAYIVQELGCALAWGNEYLHLFTEAGIPTDTVAKKMRFNVGICENYFMEIAKIRAARLLWANIVNKYEPNDTEKACQMCINAETTTYNMTVFDSYVNLLRTQTEAMSAAIAGVHSIVVKPFDTIYSQQTDQKHVVSSDFSERIARNQQLLLKEESHFDKVVDPSAGSYYIEELTCKIADSAWNLFLKIEEEGGFLEAIKKGTIQDTINTTNQKRHDDAAKRKEFILGTNQFPNFIEKSEGKMPIHHCHTEIHCNNDNAPYKRINSTRLAADYEQLRLETEQSCHVPIAFMLTIGSLVWRQARAQFSSNFLACAGYTIIDNLGFDTVEQGIDVALQAKADIIVLCSSDDEYATYAPTAYEYLANRAMFIVAGAPACMEELKEKGITNFIHVKVNVLETLKEYNAKLLKRQ